MSTGREEVRPPMLLCEKGNAVVRNHDTLKCLGDSDYVRCTLPMIRQ